MHAAGGPTHLIDFALHHGLHGRVFDHLSQHSPVAAADDQHLAEKRAEHGLSAGSARGNFRCTAKGERRESPAGPCCPTTGDGTAGPTRLPAPLARMAHGRPRPRQPCRGRGESADPGWGDPAVGAVDDSPCGGRGGCRGAGWRSFPGRRTRPAPCTGSHRPGPGRCRTWCWAERGSGVGAGLGPRSPAPSPRRQAPPRGADRPRHPPTAPGRPPAPAEDEDLLVAGALAVQEFLHLQRHGLAGP